MSTHCSRLEVLTNRIIPGNWNTCIWLSDFYPVPVCSIGLRPWWRLIGMMVSLPVLVHAHWLHVSMECHHGQSPKQIAILQLYKTKKLNDLKANWIIRLKLNQLLHKTCKISFNIVGHDWWNVFLVFNEIV